MRRCFEPEEIEGLLDLATTDPRRRHAEECPRRRALLQVYQEFLDDATVPDGARRKDAELRLRAAFQAELREKTPAAALILRTAPRPAWRPQRFALAGVAFAAVLCAVTVYSGLRLRDGRQPGDVLREASDGSASVAAPLLLPAETTGGGEVVLRWQRVPAAESYSVHIMGPDLADLTRYDAVVDTFLVLPSPGLPWRPGLDALGWQVAVLRDGQEIAASSIETLRRP